MEPYALPDGWQNFTDDALASLETVIRAGYESLGTVTPDNLSAAKSYGEALQLVRAESGTRTETAEEIDRIAAAFTTATLEPEAEIEVEVPTEVVPPAPEVEPVAEVEPEPVAEVPAEPVAEPEPEVVEAVEPAVAAEPVVAEPVAEPVIAEVAESAAEVPAETTEVVADEVDTPAEAEVAEVATEVIEPSAEVAEAQTPTPQEEPVVSEAPEAVSAAGGTAAAVTVRPGALAAMGSAIEPVSNGRMETAFNPASLVASAGIETDGADVGIRERLSELLVNERHAMDAHTGSRARFPVAYASQQYGEERTFSRDEAHNSAVMDRVGAEWRQAITAAGPICIPEATEYDITRLHQAQSPVENGLPLIGSGGQASVRIQGEPSWAEARAGLFAKTYTEMEELTPAEGGGYVSKPYARFTCPAIQEYKVALRGARARFDNLEVEVNRSFVNECIDKLLTAHAEAKDVFYLDAIEAACGAAVPWTANGYGATRNLYHGLLTAVHGLNKRAHRGPAAGVTVWLPDAAALILAIDMINDHSQGMNLLNAGLPAVAGVANRLIPGLDLRFFYHEPTSQAGVGMTGPALDGGALRELPRTIRAFMYPTGSMYRMDAGLLNLGFIRDSELNNTNDVEFFIEQWIQVVPRSTENLAVDFTLVPSGAGPTEAPIYA